MKAGQAETATFAAGCFWNVEEIFRNVPGVVDTEVGYTGGGVPDPSYERVCGGDTGHAEAVRVYFDPTQVSYEKLLTVFWENHDPAQIGGQGLDVGEQYRSVIFYHSDEQKKLAEASKDQLQQGKYKDRPVTTVIQPAKDFYRAEEYHQRYIAKQRGGA